MTEHPNLHETVCKGEQIYHDKFQAEFERRFPDQFAVVDIVSAQAVVREFPEDAILAAQERFTAGILHLIRIGSPSAFLMSGISTTHESLVRGS